MTFKYSDMCFNDLQQIERKQSRMLLDYFEKNYILGETLVKEKTHRVCVFYCNTYRILYDTFDSHVLVYRVLTE